MEASILDGNFGSTRRLRRGLESMVAAAAEGGLMVVRVPQAGVGEPNRYNRGVKQPSVASLGSLKTSRKASSIEVLMHDVPT